MSGSEVLITLTSCFGHPGAFERAGQEIVRDREFDEVDRLALDVGERGLVLEDHRVIAVREIADDDRGGVDAAGGRDRQAVHIGQRHRVIGAGGVLVHRLHVVVELGDLDGDAVLVGPFLDDAGVGGIAPGHPADIDRPGDLEIGFRCGVRRWCCPRGGRRAPGLTAVVSKSAYAIPCSGSGDWQDPAPPIPWLTRSPGLLSRRVSARMSPARWMLSDQTRDDRQDHTPEP